MNSMTTISVDARRGVHSPPRGVGEAELVLARLCLAASVRAYSLASLEGEEAHALVVPATAGCPKIIAFRGSSDVRDWLTDLRVMFRHTVFGRVHSGFWSSGHSMITPLLAGENDRQGAVEPVILTGHSKGGADATICARLLVAAGWPVERVVTFGAPRVGDRAWRDGYNGCWTGTKRLGEVTDRWVHEEDIVARMAPWLTGYRHVGHEYFISSMGGMRVDPPLLALAASDIWGTFWGYRAGRIEQVRDHSISRYQEHIGGI